MYHLNKLNHSNPEKKIDRSNRSNLFILILTILLFSTLGGCATVSKMFVTPKAVLDMRAGTELNPTYAGKSSPLKVQLYQLSSNTLAGSQSTGTSALIANSNTVKTVTLKPSQHINFTWNLQPNTTVIAVVAHYHNLTQSNWRVLIPVNPSQGKNLISLKFLNQKIYTRKS